MGKPLERYISTEAKRDALRISKQPQSGGLPIQSSQVSPDRALAPPISASNMLLRCQIESICRSGRQTIKHRSDATGTYSKIHTPPDVVQDPRCRRQIEGAYRRGHQTIKHRSDATGTYSKIYIPPDVAQDPRCRRQIERTYHSGSHTNKRHKSASKTACETGRALDV